MGQFSTETVKLITTDRRLAREQIEQVAATLDLRVDAIAEKRHLLSTTIKVTLRGESGAIEDFRVAMGSDGSTSRTQPADPVGPAPVNSMTSAVIASYNAMRRLRWRLQQGNRAPRGTPPRA